MSTIFFNSHDVKIYRRRRRTGTDRFSMSATLTVASADIQPASLERAELSGGRYGATYDCFMDESIAIKEADQVVDTATNKRYSVKSVTHWNGAGLLDHQEIVLVSMDGNDE